MERLRTELARAVDALAQAGRATVTESRTELAVYQLDGAAARDLAARLTAAGFVLSRLADEGGDLEIDQLDDASDGIELLAIKPVAPDGVLPILTRTAFMAVLTRPHAEPVVWVEELDRRVETSATCFAPWGDESQFVPNQAPADPARVVRSLDPDGHVEPIGRWLLRDPDLDVSGAVLSPWRDRAAVVLSAALAQEIERDGRLLFRGPPPTRFRGDGAPRVEAASLTALQRAAAWVFENPRELENRHGLLAAEVARTALRDGGIAELASTMAGALEGARIAFGFGVSQQSRDALKALSDLRKAVSDETGKLSDATRSLAAAVTTSAVGNAGLIIARLTLPKESSFVSTAAVAIGIGLAIYVAAVIASGWHFLAIQRDIRSDWKDRLYRFLPEGEYDRMVVTPVGRAEKAFKITAVASGLVAVLLLVAVVLILLAQA